MKRAPSVAAALLAATLGSTRSAHAGIAKDVDTIVARFRRNADVEVLAPRFYPGGATTMLPISPAAVDGRGRGCTTVVVFGAVSTSFVLELAGPSSAADTAADDFLPSVAGAAEITRCGADRVSLAELSIEVHSPHAVIETVIARSAVPLPSVRTLLPHRDPGVVPLPVRPGPPPAPASLPERAAAIENRFREEGGTDVERQMLSTDHGGAGRTMLDLAPGCHLIATLGAPSGKDDSSFRDVDAELDWTSGETAAVDRTESPDATLLACTGRRTFAVLAFAGSAPETPILMLRARRDLPAGLPERWGPEPRARMAKTFVEQKAPLVSAPPIFESFGAGTISALPIETLPGECYLAGVAPLQAGAKLTSLGATAGALRVVSHTDDPSAAAVVAFCAGPAERVTLDIDVRGTGSPLWIAAVWTEGRHRLGEDRQ